LIVFQVIFVVKEAFLCGLNQLCLHWFLVCGSIKLGLQGGFEYGLHVIIIEKMNTNNIIRKATRWLLTCALVATTGFMAKAQDAENVEEKEKTSMGNQCICWFYIDPR
jgi:hypothetical protein